MPASSTAPLFTCPRCGRDSWHPGDAEHGYCAACRWWTGDPILGQPSVIARAELEGAIDRLPDAHYWRCADGHLSCVSDAAVRHSLVTPRCPIWLSGVTGPNGMCGARLVARVEPMRPLASTLARVRRWWRARP